MNLASSQFGVLVIMLGAGSLAAGACSADPGSGSAASGKGGAAASAAGGAGGFGGGGITGGSSGVGIDASSSGGSGGIDPDAACSAIDKTAENKLQPADIVFALDNSGSMDQEAKFVQQHMNTFSSGIVGAGIDAHVVILSAVSGQSNGICIQPPLGSGQCPDDDNPPNFLHVDQPVGSTNALVLFISQFASYASMLRPGASKHFVVVTDDNSSISAASFDQQITPLLQGVDPQFQKYTFHAIYGYTKPDSFACVLNPSSDPCCDKSGFGVYTAKVGTVYAELVQMTGGQKGNLCLQDFLPVFNAVSQAIQQGSTLACEWDIPEPPNGGTIDPTQVNVQFSVGGGSPQELGYVNGAADCANVQGGWYYDVPANPTKIYVCPDTCQVIKSQQDATIKILFGCDTKPAVPS
jgi:hypothetical protein